ncbi:MAG: ABC transporter ATP-binding protein [Candidatus Curtissbacteria bacterium]
MKAIISAQNLTKVYGESPSETIALNNVSIDIAGGEFVAIIGPSGSGKSTLMHILGCLDVPTSGRYFFENREISKYNQNQLSEVRNRKIGFVFQFFNLLARTSAAKNVELPLMYAGVPRAERLKRATAGLAALGLGDKLESTPAKLSGGQQQRVAIARALVNNPLVIFADEPTGNLDSKSTDEIMNIFKKLNAGGHTIVMITHEVEVAKITKRIVTVRDGKIVSDRKTGRKR